ncbi:hypothetical protein OsJ_08257 [Oryza sativa Japonica Group]|uniref:Uncharacterized protein n=1 Tax=Oryza sativa subsp. japonica TaxID=39947 RepID=B9F2J0_ORYSJ|nr:hypothetical protein OsJ_08257 [Oryza sativa Japonica Group]
MRARKGINGKPERTAKRRRRISGEPVQAAVQRQHGSGGPRTSVWHYTTSRNMAGNREALRRVNGWQKMGS